MKKAVTYSIFVLFIGGIFIFHIIRKDSIRKKGKYTVAQIKEVKSGAKSSWTSKYVYSVNDSIYSGLVSINDYDKNIIGEKYLIVFDSTNHSRHYIDLNYKYALKYLPAPSEGWNEFPKTIFTYTNNRP